MSKPSPYVRNVYVFLFPARTPGTQQSAGKAVPDSTDIVELFSEIVGFRSRGVGPVRRPDGVPGKVFMFNAPYVRIARDPWVPLSPPGEEASSLFPHLGAAVTDWQGRRGCSLQLTAPLLDTGLPGPFADPRVRVRALHRSVMLYERTGRTGDQPTTS